MWTLPSLSWFHFPTLQCMLFPKSFTFYRNSSLIEMNTSQQRNSVHLFHKVNYRIFEKSSRSNFQLFWGALYTNAPEPAHRLDLFKRKWQFRLDILCGACLPLSQDAILNKFLRIPTEMDSVIRRLCGKNLDEATRERLRPVQLSTKNDSRQFPAERRLNLFILFYQ